MSATERRQYLAMWGWWVLIVIFCGAPLCAALGNNGFAAFFASMVAMAIAQILSGRWDWVADAYRSLDPAQQVRE